MSNERESYKLLEDCTASSPRLTRNTRRSLENIVKNEEPSSKITPIYKETLLSKNNIEPDNDCIKPTRAKKSRKTTTRTKREREKESSSANGNGRSGKKKKENEEVKAARVVRRKMGKAKEKRDFYAFEDSEARKSNGVHRRRKRNKNSKQPQFESVVYNIAYVKDVIKVKENEMVMTPVDTFRSLVKNRKYTMDEDLWFSGKHAGVMIAKREMMNPKKEQLSKTTETPKIEEQKTIKQEGICNESDDSDDSIQIYISEEESDDNGNGSESRKEIAQSGSSSDEELSTPALKINYDEIFNTPSKFVTPKPSSKGRQPLSNISNKMKNMKSENGGDIKEDKKGEDDPMKKKSHFLFSPNVAIKSQYISKPKNYHDKTYCELKILMTLGALYETNICPNFIRIFDWFKSKGGFLYDTPVPEKSTSVLKKKEKVDEYMNFVLESGEMNLKKYLKNHHQRLSLPQYQSILFQILFALYAAQRNCEFAHNDLHFGNILIRSFPENVDKIAYHLEEKKFVIEKPVLIKIIDFSLSRIKTPDDEIVCFGKDRGFIPSYDVCKVADGFAKVKLSDEGLTQEEKQQYNDLLRKLKKEMKKNTSNPKKLLKHAFFDSLICRSLHETKDSDEKNVINYGDFQVEDCKLQEKLKALLEKSNTTHNDVSKRLSFGGVKKEVSSSSLKSTTIIKSRKRNRRAL